VAADLRQTWGVAPTSRLPLERLLPALGLRVYEEPMGAKSKETYGLLVPKTRGGFDIYVDPEPPGGWRAVAPKVRSQLRRHRRRFILAHELAHALFYERPAGQPPRRLAGNSEPQEQFCDELARHLLLPEESARALSFRPEGAESLQRRFDVSLQLASRQLTHAHGEEALCWLVLTAGKAEGFQVQWRSPSTFRNAPAPRHVVPHALHELGGRRECSFLVPWLDGRPRRIRTRYWPHRGQALLTAGSV
jgi:hypothetical protein